MDVTGLDNATARLVVQIRLDEIMDALQVDVELETDLTLSYHILRRVLEDQLELIDEEDGMDADSDDSLAASEYGSDEYNSDDDRVRKLTVRTPKKGLRSKLVPKPTAMCCACGDNKPEKVTMKLSCSHTYCHDCIIDLFRFSVHKDATLFPPRCCKVPIPFYINSTSGSHDHPSVLPDKLLEEVKIKKAEYDFVHATFCSTCGRRIPDERTKDSTAECRSCNTATCTACKNKAHKGVCPEDNDTKLLIATAEKRLWQRCSHCKNMVELDHGCFHIECRCGYEFCYICGKKWKTCSCPKFDEDHIMGRTPEALEEAPVVCQHVWRHRGGTACARCDRTDLKSVMQCNICRVEQCTRCVNNRD